MLFENIWFFPSNKMNYPRVIFWFFIIFLLGLAAWQVVIAVYSKDDTSVHSSFFFVSAIVAAVLLGLMTLASVWIHNEYLFSRK